jgi:hypothetical protein
VVGPPWTGPAVVRVLDPFDKALDEGRLGLQKRDPVVVLDQEDRRDTLGHGRVELGADRLRLVGEPLQPRP